MRNWLNSNWLDLLISVLVAIAEAAMIAPWLAVFAVWVGDGTLNAWIPVGATAIGLASYWSGREVLERSWDVAAMRMATLGLWFVLLIVWYGIVSGAGSMAPLRFIDNLFQFQGLAFGVVFLGGLALWRGLSLGATGDMMTAEFTRFAAVRTVASLVVVLFIAVAFGSEQMRSTVLGTAAIAVPLGLAASLVAASAIQVRETKQRVRSAGDHRTPGSGWLGAGSAIAGAILLLGGVIAGTADRAIWGIIFWPFAQLLRGIEWVLLWVIYGLAYLVFLIFTPLFWLLEGLSGEPQEQEPIGAPPAMPWEDQAGSETSEILPAFVMQLLQWGFVLVLIGIVVWFALRQLRRYQSMGSKRQDEELRESLWSREAVLDDLSGMFGGLRSRWGARRGGIDFNDPPVTVRDAYRYTLAHAAREGLPRDQAETPAVYAGRMKSARPDVSEPLDDLTERYLRARYGERSTTDDAESARGDWEAIRRRLTNEERTS